MYSSAAKLKTSGKPTSCKDLFIPRHASKIGQIQPKVPKRHLFYLLYNRHCVFPLNRAAVVHLTHIIKGGSVETRGALKTSPAALQRKTVEFLVPALLPLWRLHVSLTWWQLEAREQCSFMATMNPTKVHIGVFFCSFIHSPSFKRILTLGAISCLTRQTMHPKLDTPYFKSNKYTHLKMNTMKYKYLQLKWLDIGVQVNTSYS